MSLDPSEASVTQWLERVQRGPDSEAAQKLWERYCTRLAAVAKRRLSDLSARCRVGDEADAIQEAFSAFFRRVEKGAYPDCHDRNDLWCLLVKIADNKARQLARGERRAKRGAGRVRGDSVFARQNADPADGFDQVADVAGELRFSGLAFEDPDEALVDRILDTLTLCYGSLDEMERNVLGRQLQGYTHREIAEQLGCVTRTVERKLKVIRSRWQSI